MLHKLAVLEESRITRTPFIDHIVNVSTKADPKRRKSEIEALLRKTSDFNMVFSKANTTPAVLKRSINNLQPNVLYHLCCWAGADIPADEDALGRAAWAAGNARTSLYLPHTTDYSLTLRRQFYEALIAHFDFDGAQQHPVRVLACLAGFAEAASQLKSNPTTKLIQFIERLPSNLNLIVASQTTAAEVVEDCRVWTHAFIGKIIENFKAFKSASRWESLLAKLIIEKRFRLWLDAKEAGKPTNTYYALDEDRLLPLAWMLLAGGAKLESALKYANDEEDKSRRLNRLWRSHDVNKAFLVDESALTDTVKCSLLMSIASHIFDETFSWDLFASDVSRELPANALSALLIKRNTIHPSLVFFAKKLKTGTLSKERMIDVKRYVEPLALTSSNPFNLMLMLHYGKDESFAIPSLEEIVNGWPKSDISLLTSILICFAKEKCIHSSILQENPWLELYAEVCPEKATEANAPVRYFNEKNEENRTSAFVNRKLLECVESFSQRELMSEIKGNLFSKIDCLAALKEALTSKNPAARITEILKLYKSLNPGSKLIGFGLYFLPLHYAVNQNLPDQLRALLASGLFDVNSVNINGITPLSLALMDDSVCIQVIREFNAAENTTDYCGVRNDVQLAANSMESAELPKKDWADLVCQLKVTTNPHLIPELEFVILSLTNPNPIYNLVSSTVDETNRPYSIYEALCELRRLFFHVNGEAIESQRLAPLLMTFIKMHVAGRLPQVLENFFARYTQPKQQEDAHAEPTNLEKAFATLEVGAGWVKALPADDTVIKNIFAEMMEWWLNYLYDLARHHSLVVSEAMIKTLAYFQRIMRLKFGVLHEGLSRLVSQSQHDDIVYHNIMFTASTIQLRTYYWPNVENSFRTYLNENTVNHFVSMLIHDGLINDKELSALYSCSKNWKPIEIIHEDEPKVIINVSQSVGLAILSRKMKSTGVNQFVKQLCDIYYSRTDTRAFIACLAQLTDHNFNFGSDLIPEGAQREIFERMAFASSAEFKEQLLEFYGFLLNPSHLDSEHKNFITKFLKECSRSGIEVKVSLQSRFNKRQPGSFYEKSRTFNEPEKEECNRALVKLLNLKEKTSANCLTAILGGETDEKINPVIISVLDTISELTLLLQEHDSDLENIERLLQQHVENVGNVPLLGFGSIGKPLLIAAEKGLNAVLNLFLSERYSKLFYLDEIDAAGNNAYLLAEKAGHVEAVEKLLQAGVRYRHKNYHGEGGSIAANQHQDPASIPLPEFKLSQIRAVALQVLSSQLPLEHPDFGLLYYFAQNFPIDDDLTRVPELKKSLYVTAFRHLYDSNLDSKDVPALLILARDLYFSPMYKDNFKRLSSVLGCPAGTPKRDVVYKLCRTIAAQDIESFTAVCNLFKTLYLSETDVERKQSIFFDWAIILMPGFMRLYPVSNLNDILHLGKKNKKRAQLTGLLQDFLDDYHSDNVEISFYLVTLVTLLDLKNITLPPVCINAPKKNTEAFLLFVVSNSSLNELSSIPKVIRNIKEDVSTLIPYFVAGLCLRCIHKILPLLERCDKGENVFDATQELLSALAFLFDFKFTQIDSTRTKLVVCLMNCFAKFLSLAQEKFTMAMFEGVTLMPDALPYRIRLSDVNRDGKTQKGVITPFGAMLTFVKPELWASVFEKFLPITIARYFGRFVQGSGHFSENPDIKENHLFAALTNHTGALALFYDYLGNPDSMTRYEFYKWLFELFDLHDNKFIPRQNLEDIIASAPDASPGTLMHWTSEALADGRVTIQQLVTVICDLHANPNELDKMIKSNKDIICILFTVLKDTIALRQNPFFKKFHEWYVEYLKVRDGLATHGEFTAFCAQLREFNKNKNMKDKETKLTDLGNALQLETPLPYEELKLAWKAFAEYLNNDSWLDVECEFVELFRSLVMPDLVQKIERKVGELAGGFFIGIPAVRLPYPFVKGKQKELLSDEEGDLQDWQRELEGGEDEDRAYIPTYEDDLLDSDVDEEKPENIFFGL